MPISGGYSRFREFFIKFVLMENSPGLQHALFEVVKTRLPEGVSLVNALADVLSVSTDSAYRRIRGETAMTIDEIAKLSQKFQFSVDSVLTNSESSIAFQYHAIDPETFTIENYLNGILADLERISRANEGEVIYFAKDLPVFHFFHFPEIANFKLFFWLRTVYQFSEFQKKSYSVDAVPAELIRLGEKVLQYYSRIPTREIWCDETVNSTLIQIKYCWDSGVFGSKDDAILLLDKMIELFRHMQEQAAVGAKFIPGLEPYGDEENYKLYYNEILLADNTILVNMDGVKLVYVPRNLLNYMVTSNPAFAQQTWSSMQNLMQKSQLISRVSEKERNIFFRTMLGRIEDLKTEIK